jgi:putative ABC transport system permease protein
VFTHCSNPECDAVYRVTAETLRTAMGMVRCVKCQTVFNALSAIVDQKPDGVVIPIRSQLPFQQFGDRMVMDPRLLKSMPAFQALKRTAANETTPPLTRTGSFVADDADDDYVRQREARLKAAEAALDTKPLGRFVGTAPAPDAALAAERTVWKNLLPTTTDFLMALRNLLRHRRRTAMGLLAISAGVVAMLFAGGFIEWSKWFLRETTIMAHLGHIQLVKKDFFQSGEADPFAYVLAEEADLLAQIEALPAVETVTPRLGFSGLLSFDDISIAVLGEGVDPQREAAVSKQLTMVTGEGLSARQKNGIIIGKGLAESLDVQAGDTVVLLVSPEGGGLGAADALVLGTFQTSNKAYDDVSIRIPIDMARRLLRTEGAHKWVILLGDTEQTVPTLEKLRATFLSRTDLEFVPWSDLADFYNKSAKLFAAQLNVIWAVIAIIIVVSISNTLIMNVVERTAEIGTLMALGLRQQRILALFVSEGFMLGCLGGLIGALIGLALGAAVSAIGIPLPPAPGMDFPVRGEIMVTWSLAIGGTLLGILATLAASIYPARKASRLVIVDALRHAR